MDTIDMDELEQELNQTRNMFQRWASSSIKAVQDCKSTHLSRLRTAKGEIVALEDRYRKAEKHLADVRECMSHDQEQAAALQQKANLLAVERQSLESQLTELQNLLEEKIQARDVRAADLEKRQLDQAERLKALQKIRNLYQSCLGLKLVPGDEELQFEFTQINPNEPDQVFGFSLTVQENDTYMVSSCNPEVPGWQQLAEEVLGRQRNVAAFTINMRRRFKELCSQASS